MILPLIMPTDGEVYNLAQIVKWKSVTDDCCTVAFADGATRKFTGDAAAVVRGEIVFAFNLYRQFVAGVQQSAAGPPLIVPPNFGGKVL